MKKVVIKYLTDDQIFASSITYKVLGMSRLMIKACLGPGFNKLEEHIRSISVQF